MGRSYLQLLFVLLFSCVLGLYPDVVSAAKPRLLLIESYHSDYSWDMEMIHGLKLTLKDKVEFYGFQMDTKRIKDDEYTDRALQAWEYYTEVKPDVVVLSDDNALKYLGPKLLETKTPVVYMGINDNPRRYIPLNKNITGVLERPLYKRTIKFIKELLRLDKGKVLILLDNGVTSESFKSSVFMNKDCMSIMGMHTDLRLTSDYGVWKHEVLNSIQKYDAIVIGLYHRVFEKGIHVKSEDVLNWTSEHSPVPVFAFWRMSVGKGKAIGGMVLDGTEQGIAAGEVVLKVLEGVPPKDIKPIIPDRGKFVFSRSELARWKIRIPPSIREESRFLP